MSPTTDTDVSLHAAGRTRRFAHLRRRSDFLKAAKGRRSHGRALTLQAAKRGRGDASRGDAGEARFGLTVTKKTGGAVERNRIRRRLREALRSLPDLAAHGDHDYVMVARRDALTMPFTALTDEIDRLMRQVHGAAQQGSAGGQRRRPEVTGEAQAHRVASAREGAASVSSQAPSPARVVDAAAAETER